MIPITTYSDKFSQRNLFYRENNSYMQRKVAFVHLILQLKQHWAW